MKVIRASKVSLKRLKIWQTSRKAHLFFINHVVLWTQNKSGSFLNKQSWWFYDLSIFKANIKISEEPFHSFGVNLIFRGTIEMFFDIMHSLWDFLQWAVTTRPLGLFVSFVVGRFFHNSIRLHFKRLNSLLIKTKKTTSRSQKKNKGKGGFDFGPIKM